MDGPELAMRNAMDPGFITAEQIKESKRSFFRELRDFDDNRATGASYDLSLGEEVYLSGQDYPRLLSESDPFVIIPRGQFALLTTKEYITMPLDYLGFISIKFSIKKLGLINISGFHVDPGRDGKLIFSVYNAGPEDVVLKYGDPVFMIFFCRLANKAEEYRSKEGLKGTEHLPVGWVTALKGTSASLSDLDKRVRDLEVTTKLFVGLLVALAAGMIGLFVVQLL